MSAKCKKCQRPFRQGEYRLGSPEDGWEHPGNCPATVPWYVKRTHLDAPPDISEYSNCCSWAEGYNAAVRAYQADFAENLRRERL
jgi:hypothetical protein